MLKVVVSDALADVLTRFVKPDEGGYVERNSEPGGAGNFGISFATFDAWRQLNGYGHSDFNDLKNMSWSEAMHIYAHLYAQPAFFDQVAPGSNYVLLDSAINNGVGGETGFARKALGMPVEDAKGRKLRFTPDVLLGVQKMGPKDFVNKFCDVRLAAQKDFRLYGELVPPKNTHTYGSVWDRRVRTVRERAMSLIQGTHL